MAYHPIISIVKHFIYIYNVSSTDKVNAFKFLCPLNKGINDFNRSQYYYTTLNYILLTTLLTAVQMQECMVLVTCDALLHTSTVTQSNRGK